MYTIDKGKFLKHHLDDSIKKERYELAKYIQDRINEHEKRTI